MNKIYTTVWCESRQQWVVTSELATGSGRPKLTPKKSALALLLGAVLLPSGPAMSIDYVGVTVDVNTTGPQILYSGDTATDTTITAGTYQRISSGGKATITTINGGSQRISGGSATSTTISGAYQEVMVERPPSTAAAPTSLKQRHSDFHYHQQQWCSTHLQWWPGQSTDIRNGGVQHISNGGTANSTTISAVLQWWIGHHTTINGGSQRLKRRHSVLHSTTVVFNTFFMEARLQVLLSTAAVLRTSLVAVRSPLRLSPMEVISTSTVALATFTIISGSFSSQQLSGGTANNTTIHSGGRQSVYAGSEATSTTINNARTSSAVVQPYLLLSVAGNLSPWAVRQSLLLSKEDSSSIVVPQPLLPL
jgi:autotransporter passenger strand-loop-strand repeat protein